MVDEREDGVNEDGLDYRAGYVESLTALMTNLRIQGVRCKKGESAGLDLSYQTAYNLRRVMLEKMKVS